MQDVQLPHYLCHVGGSKTYILITWYLEKIGWWRAWCEIMETGNDSNRVNRMEQHQKLTVVITSLSGVGLYAESSFPGMACVMACRVAWRRKSCLFCVEMGQLHYHAYRLSLFESVRQFVKDFRASGKTLGFGVQRRIYMPLLRIACDLRRIWVECCHKSPRPFPLV